MFFYSYVILPALFVLPILAQNLAPTPMTGKEVPELAAYEQALRPVVEKWKVPGAAVAITDRGRLVYARGFGFADREAGIPVQPTSLFRLASISKTLAGMTAMKLVEEGKLNLDSKFMDLIPNLPPSTLTVTDPRMRTVTVRQLLQHVAGFDRPVEDDYVIYYNTASKLFNLPVSKDLMTRYAQSVKLDFNPGDKFAYGNTSHQIIGRIIERLTGQTYEDAMRQRILTPSGAMGIRQGHALLENRFPDEVKYYDYPGAPLSTSPVVPGAPRPTPRQYGNNWTEMGDSYGGMIGNVVDLMKYVNALEGRRGQALLSASTINTILQRPAPPASGGTAPYTGITWRITPIAGGGAHWWHSGGATGTRNLLARRQNGRDWVILTNTRPEDQDSIIDDLFAAMAAAEAKVTSWPAQDLFADFAGPTLVTSADVLTFSASGSAVTAAQTLGITASGGPLSGITVETLIAQKNALPTATPASHWLKVDRKSGLTAPASIAVSADPAGLQAGTYEALLRITGPNLANSSRYVRVVLNVANPSVLSAIRNSATLEVVQAAAPQSRLVLETTGKVGDGVTVDVGGFAATVLGVTTRGVEIVVPAEVPLGDTAIAITLPSGSVIRDRIRIDAVSPGLFSANGTGKGPARATVQTTGEDGAVSDAVPVYNCDDPGNCFTVPIDLGSETDTVLLQFTATGVRGAAGDLTSFRVLIGDDDADLVSVQASDVEAGVDIIIVRLPRILAGRGELDLTLTALGKTSNPVQIQLQ